MTFTQSLLRTPLWHGRTRSIRRLSIGVWLATLLLAAWMSRVGRAPHREGKALAFLLWCEAGSKCFLLFTWFDCIWCDWSGICAAVAVATAPVATTDASQSTGQRTLGVQAIVAASWLYSFQTITNNSNHDCLILIGLCCIVSCSPTSLGPTGGVLEKVGVEYFCAYTTTLLARVR